MTYYTLEFQQGAITSTTGVQQETFRFKYSRAPQLILKYLRVDHILWAGTNNSGECFGGLAFGYFNADPPVTSVAQQTLSSLTNVFNGIRFNIDRFKAFEIPEGLPLPTNKDFSMGLTWFGLPVGVTVTAFMSVTMGFEVPESKFWGKILSPEKIFKKEFDSRLPKTFFDIQRVTIDSENPTREVPTA